MVRVMIVDDDMNFRYALREVIPWKENGFEVVAEAIHGKQALDLLGQTMTDIVITDIDSVFILLLLFVSIIIF